MSKHDKRLEQKSPAKPEISALDDIELDKVTGGGKAKDTFPSESVSLSYGRIEWSYTQQK